MNQLVKEKWVAALRSGKYVKTKGQLCGGINCYCPLGLLGIINGFTILSDDNTFKEDLDVDSEKGPYPALSKFGLTGKEMGDIFTKNDTEFMSFEEMADYIENNY